jgi:hypothetical protein
MIKSSQQSNLVDFISDRMSNEQFVKNNSEMSDKERNRKEFRRLFGTFTLRAIDLEEMFCSLLNIQTMESSDVIYNIDLH